MNRTITTAVSVAVVAAAIIGAHAAAPGPATATTASTPFVVVIDAGHQKKADLRLERIGPGSSKKKPRVAGGTRGVVTRKRESTINLQIALKLRDELKKRGVKVVMVRTSQNVNISNSQRAKIGNRARADLVVRLHCDGAANRSVRGLLTITPKKNRWTKAFSAKSLRAGRDIQRATLKATKARDRGISRRGDMTGFNWSKVPSVIVEMGVMTNRAEDRKLASASYQKKLVEGIADGIMVYLRR